MMGARTFSFIGGDTMKRTILFLFTAVAFIAACDQQPTEIVDSPNFSVYPAGTNFELRLTCYGPFENHGGRAVIGFPNLGPAGVAASMSCNTTAVLANERRIDTRTVTVPVDVSTVEYFIELNAPGRQDPQCHDTLPLDLPLRVMCTYIDNDRTSTLAECEDHLGTKFLPPICKRTGMMLEIRTVGGQS